MPLGNLLLLAGQAGPIVEILGGHVVPEHAHDQVAQRRPEVLQVVRVQQRVDRRVQMGQNYAEQHQRRWNLAVPAEGHDAVDRVQRNPADHEEEDDDREVLGGLDFALLGGTEHAQHGAAAVAVFAGTAAGSGRYPDAAAFRGAAALGAGGGQTAGRVHRDDLAELGEGRICYKNFVE